VQLSPNQTKIVEATDKYSYVIAGAGSGKTRTLTAKVERLLSSAQRGEKVLAITFSNKAANELRERLCSVFSEDKLEDLAYVGTIHNFCMQVLLARASSIGLSSDIQIFESVEDRMEIFKAAIDTVPSFKQKCIDDQNPARKAREFFDLLSKAKRDFRFPSDYNDRPQSQQLYRSYTDLMLAQNAIDFDDILLLTYRIFIENPNVAKIYQRIYKSICIDEAQDLNRAQYEVIKAIAGETASIFMVGDPNQAIYGFNGSSSEFMCTQFEKDYNAHRYVLYENYRSSKEVISAAKKIEDAFEMEGLLPVNGECRIFSFSDELTEAEWVVSKIRELLVIGHPDVEDSPVTLDRIAVLARTKYVFSSLETVLHNESIEYHVRASTNSGFSSESLVFKVFDLSLRLIVNLKDKLHLNELLALLHIPESNAVDFISLWHGKDILEKLSGTEFTLLDEVWRILSENTSSFHFEKCLLKMQAFCNSADNFSSDDERSLVYSDFSAWQERWITYVKKSTIESRSLSNMLHALALGITSIETKNGLTLSTVHMSKGLEFDVVFIIGLNEGVFPDYRAVKDETQLQEEKHNMFVSITRSRRLCYITFPQKKKMPWGDIRNQYQSRYITWLQQ